MNKSDVVIKRVNDAIQQIEAMEKSGRHREHIEFFVQKFTDEFNKVLLTPRTFPTIRTFLHFVEKYKVT